MRGGRALGVVASAVAVTAAAPAARASDSTPITIFARLGGLTRADSGYFHDARVFGYPLPATMGGTVDASIELLPRLSLGVSASYFGSSAERRLSRLALASQAYLVNAKYAIWRARLHDEKGGDLLAQMQLTAGSGLYRVREEFRDQSLFATPFVQKETGAGARVGVEASAFFGVVGVMVTYALHHAPEVGVEDRIGGRVGAGGHEVAGGVGVRF